MCARLNNPPDASRPALPPGVARALGWTWFGLASIPVDRSQRVFIALPIENRQIAYYTSCAWRFVGFSARNFQGVFFVHFWLTPLRALSATPTRFDQSA